MSGSEVANSAIALQGWLDRHQAGDESARRELLSVAIGRLRLLSRKILADIPGVKRWEDTEDLLQNATIRLWRALESHFPPTPLDFFRLAACLIRRELIDMSRGLFGPMGIGANHDSRALQRNPPSTAELFAAAESSDPGQLSEWTEFHEYVEQLPEESRVLFDLLWYQGLTMAETSALTGIPLRTLSRRWKLARINLYKALLDDGSRGEL